ncbi:hypothetical protein MNBD_GAMMA01-1292 [hydrothermal vent metagenome]|uniref:Uncharacterized protein n=1 Tax=hydrothermal vent metagenome TaxID=652676 RepID=A0A3B0VIP5_9ZZZZ
MFVFKKKGQKKSVLSYMFVKGTTMQDLKDEKEALANIYNLDIDNITIRYFNPSKGEF